MAAMQGAGTEQLKTCEYGVTHRGSVGKTAFVACTAEKLRFLLQIT